VGGYAASRSATAFVALTVALYEHFVISGFSFSAEIVPLVELVQPAREERVVWGAGMGGSMVLERLFVLENELRDTVANVGDSSVGSMSLGYGGLVVT
jgi:hypothetical protein